EPNVRPEELAKVRAKTLVVAGTRDIIRRSHSELIARSIPGSRLAFIEGGHFIAARNPAAFNRAVLDFLTE
ncbi:MAG: alpha/beta hydrolase, partial [Firmicutes bacterium]|nr:alpha/beta hydrolase [Bacillota bacterium]